jgi:chromate transporter
LAEAESPIPVDAEITAPPRIGVLRIFAAFMRLGCTSFGGGTAGWLYREIVLKRGWVDDRAFLSMLALGQTMPGSGGTNLTVLVGQRLRGAVGAVAALSGLLALPFVINLVLGSFYAGYGDQPLVEQMLDGVAAAVIGLTLATGLRSLRQASPGPAGLTIAGVTIVAVGVLRWPILPVVAVVAPASIGFAFLQGRRR